MAVAAEDVPDAMLALALARDVDRSFERVVIAYRGDVVAFVARLLQDRARAEDVAQDVFVRAYRALHAYPPQRRATLRLRSWLLAIARNLALNAVRDAPPPADPLFHDDGAPRAVVADASPGPDELVLRDEEWASVADAVATLSPALRAAFVMRYVEDLPYDEIARRLAQPVGTVKASAHRGLRAVQARLEGADD